MEKYDGNIYDYAASFYDEIIEHFDARLTMIEAESVVAFQLEFVDGIFIASSKEFECIKEETFLQRIPSKYCVDSKISREDILIFDFPWIWGIKPKKSSIWDSTTGKKDALCVLSTTGRI
jgi:hypothetical protein